MKKLCLCSSLLPETAVQRLESEFCVILLPPDHSIAEPVSCHPDMICSVIDSTIFFHSSYAETYPDIIAAVTRKSGLRPVLTNEERSNRYPNDIALNAAVLNRAVLCREVHTSPALLETARRSGRSVINVKQGYAACSCIVCGESVITSDRGIQKALAAIGTDCVYIAPDGILLPGYSGGFIGGSGGYADGKIYLTGNLSWISDGVVLRDFADQRRFEIICLTNDPLTDYGGLKFI